MTAKLAIRQTSLGTDRNHSRYWLFHADSSPGVYVEKGNSECAYFFILFCKRSWLYLSFSIFSMILINLMVNRFFLFIKRHAGWAPKEIQWTLKTAEEFSDDSGSDEFGSESDEENQGDEQKKRKRRTKASNRSEKTFVFSQAIYKIKTYRNLQIKLIVCVFYLIAKS